MTDYLTVTNADTPMARTGAIKLHGPEGFAGMRAAGQLAAETLDMIVPHVVPGVTTGALDDMIRRSSSIAAASRRRSAIAAIPTAAAFRSTMSSATASPATRR